MRRNGQFLQFHFSSGIAISGLFTALLSMLFLLKLPRPVPIQKGKRNWIAGLAIGCGLYAIYRMVWDFVYLVLSFVREIGPAKSMTIPILSGPLEFLYSRLVYWADGFTGSGAVRWFLIEIVPMCILSALIFTALYGVRLLRKASFYTVL